MRVVRRPLAPGQTDYELVCLFVSLVGLAFAWIWFAIGLPWPHCIFLTITGHPCLTCGATRCAIAFFHLDFAAAWKWNPLVFALLCWISIFDLYAAVVLILRARRFRVIQFTPAETKFLRVVFILVLLTNWIYLLSRPRGLF